MTRIRTALAATVAIAAACLAPQAPGAAAPRTCGLPTSDPIWIDFGGGSVRPDTRAVLSRPGVVVTTAGTGVPESFRAAGVPTTYFEIDLPDLVGSPNMPADPAFVPGAAAELLADARLSMACETPWIALNELFGSGTKAPWLPSIAQYRSNVLVLMRTLAEGGAYPFLLVHGDPTVEGETAAWWRDVAEAGDLVYEAYYDASRISALGPVIGNRRMRQGMRGIVRLFTSVGVPRDRLGFMLGFHSAQTPGIGGRQGLQPREEWLRIVKWEALAARQVAVDESIPSIWSWGWATFGPPSVDPDKPAAACVWLWTRDSSLCDGPAVGGAAFNASVTEGQILLGRAHCASPDGHVTVEAVDALAAFTGDRHVAVTALFARLSLRGVEVSEDAVLAAERRVIATEFDGDRGKYERALARRDASPRIARGVIRDELRRRAIRRMLRESGSPLATLEWTNDVETKAAENVICQRDELPGAGDFPRSNALDVGVVQLPARLPFLFDDTTPPAAPAAPTATPGPGTVALAWPYGAEADLAGYRVYRATKSGGPYARLDTKPFLPILPRPAFVDRTAPTGQTSYFVVRAVDSSGNESEPSPEIAAAPGAAAAPARLDP